MRLEFLIRVVVDHVPNDLDAGEVELKIDQMALVKKGETKALPVKFISEETVGGVRVLLISSQGAVP